MTILYVQTVTDNPEIPLLQGHPDCCDNTPMTKVTSSKLSAYGLRYDAKPPGSPFLGTGNTRSCFICGTHRQHAQLQSKRVLGRTEMVCAPACNRVGT